MNKAHLQPAGNLLAMHRGDAAAARALWEAHAGRLTALARAITGSHADGLDAVQEAFTAVLGLTASQAAAVDDEAAYLAGAVRSRALNIVRSSARRQRHESRAAAASTLKPAGIPDADQPLEDALSSLQLDDREVVALKHLAGLTFDQMAAALEVPRATAASRYYAAVERLRAAVDAHRASSREVARA